ncbi:MAG: elongation factor P [Candidatus Pacebacteria bacterium]|nr:elongation factor P [Candidatus Paceibacterota bacterium]
MLTHNDLKRGARFILNQEPYEVLDSFPIKKAQGRAIVQTRIKNLITGAVLDKNFHQGDVFDQADISKIDIKFLYSHKDKFIFSERNNPSKRFELSENQLGSSSKFLKPNEIVEGLVFDDKIINISLPIKIQLKVIEAPPSFKGNTAQGGTKTVKLETKAEINAPLFINEGDIIEINTEKEEYVKRIEKK